ncbi:MAG: hypothetical protein KC800_32755, partial [Candidatus Eremiobacteraeota bacterium]|nr:hypothetical protein [Candidatus Eremiobacteraeota bacterium]
MSFRRPQKTPLQRALREAERSVSGALFLLLEPRDADAKVDLRSRFAAGLCAILIAQKHLTTLQAEKQLSEGQLEVLRTLPEGEVPSPQLLWGEWLNSERSIAATLGTWLELGSRYVSARLRDEAEPSPIDWSRRDQEMLQQFSSFPGKTVLRLETGLVQIVEQDRVTAQATVEVLGSYDETTLTYLAGWSDPELPAVARPLPIFGCASQLFRLTLVEAQSEARRACWLGKVYYLYEAVKDSRHYFLGLDKLEGSGFDSNFGKSDFSTEMLARVETIRKAATHMEPDRFKGLLTSQSQEVRRLAQLADGNAPLSAAIIQTAD